MKITKKYLQKLIESELNDLLKEQKRDPRLQQPLMRKGAMNRRAEVGDSFLHSDPGTQVKMQTGDMDIDDFDKSDGGFTDAERAAAAADLKLKGPTNRYMGPTKLTAAFKPMYDLQADLISAMEDFEAVDSKSYAYLLDAFRAVKFGLQDFAHRLGQINRNAKRGKGYDQDPMARKSGDPTMFDDDYQIASRARTIAAADRGEDVEGRSYTDTQARERAAQIARARSRRK